MRQIVWVIGWILRTTMTIVGSLVFIATILIFIAWQIGAIEKYAPQLHCLMTREREGRFVIMGDSSVAHIRLDSLCNCDTVYYQQVNTTPHAKATKAP